MTTQSKARDFEKERKDHMIFLQPEEDREEITPEDFVKEIGSALQEPQAVSAYEEWAKTLGVEINKEIVCRGFPLTDVNSLTNNLSSNKLPPTLPRTSQPWMTRRLSTGHRTYVPLARPRAQERLPANHVITVRRRRLRPPI